MKGFAARVESLLPTNACNSAHMMTTHTHTGHTREKESKSKGVGRQLTPTSEESPVSEENAATPPLPT
jgi:hypothetical protein